MAINLISVKCPDCGASLDVNDSLSQIYCTYCGAKIIIKNDNEHIYRHIDEAELKQAETERMIMLKKLELEEKKRLDEIEARKNKLRITVILGILAFIFMLTKMGIMFVPLFLFAIIMIWINPSSKSKDESEPVDDNIKIPKKLSQYEGMNYSIAESLLRNAGFSDIKCIELKDLVFGVFNKAGTVASITINGTELRSFRKKYPCDSPIVITYHSFK